jgi:hypothetical protein
VETRLNRKPHWAGIRASYEANSSSVRGLAAEHGMSHTAILKRAKAENWTRAARPDVVHTGNVAVEQTVKSNGPSDVLGLALAEVAEIGPKVLVSRGRDLVARLFDELSASTTHRGEIENLIIDETRGDKDGRRRYAMMKAVSLSARAAVVKNLALAAKTLSDAAPTGGKKEETRDRAAVASKIGRFATPPTPPKLVVETREPA